MGTWSWMGTSELDGDVRAGSDAVPELACFAAPACVEGAVRVEQGMGPSARGEGDVGERELLAAPLDEARRAEVAVIIEPLAPHVAIRIDGQPGVEGHRVGKQGYLDPGWVVDHGGLGHIKRDSEELAQSESRPAAIES